MLSTSKFRMEIKDYLLYIYIHIYIFYFLKNISIFFCKIMIKCVCNCQSFLWIKIAVCLNDFRDIKMLSLKLFGFYNENVTR